MRRQTPLIISPDLVAQVARGDRNAFSRLYDLSSSLLFTLAKRILDESDETSELLQEVYVEIWQKARQFDPNRGSPLSWMVTMTRSRALDRVRSKGWKARILTEHLDDHSMVQPVTSGTGPQESVEARELKEIVGKALRVLPDEQCLVLELSYYEGLSHREIADRLQEPVGTIKTRIRLAVMKLRESLQSYWTQESA